MVSSMKLAPAIVLLLSAGPALAEHDEGPCAWSSYPPPEHHVAIGFAKGHVEQADDTDGHQRALLARVVLRHGFELELELAKTTLGDDHARTAGGAVIKTLGYHRHFAPYLALGGGGGELERADGREPHLAYGELGGGLMLRGRHLALALDVRAGVRRIEAEAIAVARTAADIVATPEPEAERDRYVRARLALLAYF